MAEHYSFFDAFLGSDGVPDREYNARSFMRHFKPWITNGVVRSFGDELAMINDNASMSTVLKTGAAYIDGHMYESDADKNFIHDIESAGKSRFDMIVLRLDLNDAARNIKSFLVKGVAAATPVKPTLTVSDKVYEIALYAVKVVGGQSFISAENVEDIRPWSRNNLIPNLSGTGVVEHLENKNLSHVPYVICSGSANSYTATITGLEEVTEGTALSVKIPVTNTGATTINVNEFGAKTIKKSNGNDMKLGDLKENSIYTLRFDGMVFILQGEGGDYGTATAEHVLQGYTLGTNSGIVDGTYIPEACNYGTARGAQVLQGYTTGTSGGLINGTIPTRTTGVIVPSTSNQTKSAGYYESDIVIQGDSDLKASNIKQGVNIFGVTGSYQLEFKNQTVYANVAPSSSSTSRVFYSYDFVFGFVPKVVVARMSITGNFGGYSLNAMFILLVNNGSVTMPQNAYFKNDAQSSYQFLIENNSSTFNGTTLKLSVALNSDWVSINNPTAYIELRGYGA